MSTVDNTDSIVIVKVTYNKIRRRHFYRITKKSNGKEMGLKEVGFVGQEGDIRSILSKFINNITGASNNFLFLRELVDRFADENIQNKFIPLLKEKGDPIEVDDKTLMAFEIDEDHLNKDSILTSDLGHATRANIALGPMVLLSMTAHYDVFVSSLISFYLNKHPGILDNSEKVFTLSELKKLGSVEEAQQNILEREIDEVMYGSHLSQVEWFDKKLKKNIKGMLRSIPEFCEIFERRNLYAHSSNLVSQRYINNCKKFGTNNGDLPTIGQNLVSNGDYIHQSSRIIIEYGIILSQVVWRSLHKSEKAQIQLADDMLLGNCDMISRSGQSDLAIFLLDLAINKMNPSDEMHQREMVIRQSSLHMMQGDEKAAIDLLGKYDWTASNVRFRFYKDIISKDFDSAAKLLKAVQGEFDVAGSDITKSSALKNLSKIGEFKDAFQILGLKGV